MYRILAALLGALLLVGVLRSQFAGGPDAARRGASAAPRSPGGRLTVATEGGRRSFRVGERIPIVLTYDNVFTRQLLEGTSLRRLATVVLDHTDGTANPFADYDRADFSVPDGVCDHVSSEGVCGGGIDDTGPAMGVLTLGPSLTPFGPPPMPAPPAVRLSMLLNDAVRFDAPGRYRLHIVDDYDSRRYREADVAPSSSAAAPLESNVMEIEITPRDAAWETATLDAAVRVLEASADIMAREEAARTLRVMGSPRAIEAMARVLARGFREGDESRELEAGLFAAADRAAAIASVEREVTARPAEVPLAYLRTLAGLRLTQASRDDYLDDTAKRSALLALETRRMAALKQSGTLVPYFVSTFTSLTHDDGRETQGYLYGVVVTRAIAAFAEDAAAALRQLPAASRDAIVARLGGSFTDPRFVPMLDEMAANGSEPALRVLRDTAPDRARQLVLDDLATAHPRFSLELAETIVEGPQPSLDRAFEAQLAAASDPTQVRDSFSRIARFASPAILPAVRDAYLARADVASCEVVPPVLAYFFRVDADGARATWTAVQRDGRRQRRDCERWPAELLGAVARHAWSPALEDFTAGFLRHPDEADVMVAGGLLSQFGSSRMQPLLWTALESWRARWTPARAAVLGADITVESALEQTLVMDLAEGRAWRLRAEDVKRLRDGCRLRGCDGTVRRLMEDDGRLKEPLMSGHYDEGSGETRYYLAVPDLTPRQLEQRIAVYPAGTSFHWTGDYDEPIAAWYGDAAAPFRRAQELATQAGMTIHRHLRPERRR